MYTVCFYICHGSLLLRSHGDMRTKESGHCRVYGWSSNNTHLKSTYIPVCWYRVVHMTGPNQRNRYAPWSTSTPLYIRHQAPSLHIIESLSRMGPWKLTSHQVFTKTGHFRDLQRARGCRSPAREVSFDDFGTRTLQHGDFMRQSFKVQPLKHSIHIHSYMYCILYAPRVCAPCSIFASVQAPRIP